ncbi:hypothetical protein QJS10_CPB04g00268 [Acorus calamus]|uniref:DUF642 domain-containing protein n=1 Tax=Acorus calamus TaxID=4465 RepID=A0AAV9F002_ACOCL|nr:hypothetical protein QJS10_CPB04g00268 [Acorus calamus]
MPPHVISINNFSSRPAQEPKLRIPTIKSPSQHNHHHPLSTNTTIPGWSFTGTVHYVTAGPNLSLPNGGGHAIQLGRGGKINQTFKSSSAYADDNENCSAVAGVNVSGLGYSSVFTIEGRYGRERWESHAFYMLGLIERGLPVDVEIESVAMEGDPDVLCGPVVDTFVLKEVDVPKGYNDNILTNGGFETGPAFIQNSSEGVLLDQDKYDRYSVLQLWSVIGTVKYIDSKHYMVPKGNAAVELVSGPYSGIAIDLGLMTSPAYKLSFAMGDANDTCAGEFVVGVQAGLGEGIMNCIMKILNVRKFHYHEILHCCKRVRNDQEINE